MQQLIILLAAGWWILFVFAFLVLAWVLVLFRATRDPNEMKYPSNGKLVEVDECEDSISK